MDILKIVKAQLEPTQGRGRGGRGRKELILIIYDTVWVYRIHKRRDSELDRGNPDGVIDIRAKYALVFTGHDDSNAIAQCYAMRGHAAEAEWTHDWHDLPAAIERLRGRHPGEPFPDEIDYVIDWPSYYYWSHMKNASSPERQKSIQAFLDQAGRS